MLDGSEEGELSAGGDAGAGGGESGFHVVDGAQRDGVELAGGREGFGASGPDFNVGKVKGADDFAEEGGLFVLGFGQGDVGLGVKEGDGEAGEAGSGAQVEEGGRGAEVLGGEEAFSEVAANDLLRVADGSEVGTGVPLEEEIEVGGEAGHEVFWRGDGQVGGEEGGDLGFGEGGHRDFSIADGLSEPWFRA